MDDGATDAPAVLAHRLGLTFYGGLLSAAGLLVEVGLLDSASDDADRRALTWHTYLWDPWFALWGAAFTVTMWRTRTTRPPGAVRRLTESVSSAPWPVTVDGARTTEAVGRGDHGPG